ncbi:uncharacterized protein LOC100707044 isoform X2 [Oreochromis niloticus]|uniref:uncharacterized protein LOC100707044 isoform X2 n=1 Tax=Oreochromis niloticus TaxID=8128 RepID=UPI0003940C5B|nr:uncharacterized protein LOC100707044 isoform X2 [Oreochromis niloticus]CAI5662716.1 unnamed protein product [Mustela putorius furo]
MQLPGLIGFISVLVLACNSKDTEWKINVERTITAQPGSTVTIHCNFSYPQEYHTNNVTVFWKMLSVKDPTKCSNKDKHKWAFVFNTNNDCVLEKYRGKTKLIGDQNKGNCSLQITNITHIEQAIYVRIDVQKDKYSFDKDLVSVSFSMNGTGASDPGTDSYMTHDPLPTETTITKANENDTSLATILSVAIPVAVLVVIILLVAGIFIFIKYKRSRSVTREDSGYYANFSRALSNPPKREVTCDTQAKKLPEGKAIDDPVYINVKAPTGHMAPNSSSADNIYANVDYRT